MENSALPLSLQACLASLCWVHSSSRLEGEPGSEGGVLKASSGAFVLKSCFYHLFVMSDFSEVTALTSELLL